MTSFITSDSLNIARILQHFDYSGNFTCAETHSLAYLWLAKIDIFFNQIVKCFYIATYLANMIRIYLAMSIMHDNQQCTSR